MEAKRKASECPICNQEASWLFSAPCDYLKPTDSKPYEVSWCNACSFGQISERPTKQEVADFYVLDSYYTHNTSASNCDGRIGNELFCDRLRTHLSWHLDRGAELSPNDVISLLEGNSPTMLEIGCENGGNILKFLGEGFSAVGVEPDQKAREAAKEAGVTVYEGTAEELPEAILGSKYDIVLMSHVLEHCLDINAAVSNAKSVLKKGGVFIVETPNCASQGFKDYKAAWPWSDIRRHLNFFTPSSLYSVLSKHEFNVVTEKYRGFCRQFSNSWLNTEEEIWHSFQDCSTQSEPKPNFRLRAWKLLLKSLFSSKSAKYDFVRLIATKI